MSWYQENKFAATLLGVTVVVSGVLVYLGMNANTDAEAARKKERSAVSKINNLQAAKPYPNKDNEKMLAEGLATFAADTKKFQETILKFRPEKMQRLSANEFSSKVSNHHNKLKKYYSEKKIELPEKAKVFFGMEDYANRMAPEESTRYLNYQREALEWLFVNLADSGISSLNNVYRAPVAEVLGKAPKAKPSRRSAENTTKLDSVYDTLPIEITFTGSEDGLQKFISEVTANDKYFFAIKLLKVRNEEQDTVQISKATFKPTAAPPAEVIPGTEPAEGAAGGGFDLGAGFDLGGDDFAVVEDKEIIKQVIGDEKIMVFMQLDLVLFKEASKITIPRLKKENPDAPGTPSTEAPKKVTNK